ncbi:MAG: nitroreductase family protein, partial [Tidjanibacter sp.]|nr:nitroreductase family protein [Tidjanibacter sp.]
MEFFELVERRHSVRSFTGEPVEQAAITRILKAALSAPSAKNTRSSSFMVVEEPELIGRIARMRDYGSAFVEKAPLVILVMGDQLRSDLWEVNAAISATYVQLAAQALELGSCWVHVAGRPQRREE